MTDGYPAFGKLCRFRVTISNEELFPGVMHWSKFADVPGAGGSGVLRHDCRKTPDPINSSEIVLRKCFVITIFKGFKFAKFYPVLKGKN
jgi:hypothetical protein